MFIDSHAHIDGPEFDSDRDDVIQRAHDAGVSIILNVGTGNPAEGVFERAVEFGQKNSSLYTAIGVHPHDASHYTEAVEERIRTLIQGDKRVVAWGEIGLDFHYDNSPRDVQVDAFIRQLRAARELDVPVIIHTRDAERETIAILDDEYADAPRKGVFHCFTGTTYLADRALKSGYTISFSGIVTFKKAEELRHIASNVPIGRMLVETDCPYLAPVPYRGKRNEPAYVVEVAKCIAGLRQQPVSMIAEATTRNFAQLFDIDLPS
jgi:TatD DNase family protein